MGSISQKGIRQLGLIFLAVMTAIGLFGCRDDAVVDNPYGDKTVVEKTVAVVLPYEQGLDAHWHRCLQLFSANFERAFKSQEKAVRLNFEYYDESTEDLAKLSRERSD